MMLNRLKKEIKEIKDKNLYRELKDISLNGKFITHNGQQLLNLSSNDYLGYFQDKRVIDASVVATKKYGTSSTSSRLVCGNNNLYSEVENLISKIKNTESALIFNSGYAANVGILNSISTDKTYILADKLIHASIIDSIKMSNCKFSRFSHNNIENLKQKLDKIDRKRYPEIIICIESVYSMDGDIAPLKELKSIADNHNTILYVDEAHSTGIYGENGQGLCSNIIDDNLIIMGTFGKGLGNFGAYFAGSSIIKDYLINKARSLIYTTAMPPSVLGGLKKVFELLKEENRGKELLEKTKYFREKLSFIFTKENYSASDSPIIPIILGETQKAMNIRDKLYDIGFFTVVIREPTVPKNSARLRLTINNLLNYKDLDDILEALKKVIYES